MEMRSQGVDHRRIGLLAALAVASSRQHRPSLRHCSLGGCLQQPGLADPRLASQQEERYGNRCTTLPLEKLIQDGEFAEAAHQRHETRREEGGMGLPIQDARRTGRRQGEGRTVVLRETQGG